MAYDKACYERRKNLVIKKSDGDEFVAYREIRKKWGIDDFRIKELLKTNTLTEIMEGERVCGKMVPKEMVYIDRQIVAYAFFAAIIAWLCVTWSAHEANAIYEPILSFTNR